MLTKACNHYSIPWKNTGRVLHCHQDRRRKGLLECNAGKWIVAQDDEEAKFLADMEKKAKRLEVPVHFISEAERLVGFHSRWMITREGSKVESLGQGTPSQM